MVYPECEKMSAVQEARHRAQGSFEAGWEGRVMKRFVLICAILCMFTCKAEAGFNFGQDTYEQVDNILIVNSLGDKATESQFKYKDYNLGYNDYIPENAFKNAYYQDGYTKLYDFDDVKLDLVGVGYMGRLGDPRTYDTDYVLREEWEKYSAQYQDVRINKNSSRIYTNKLHIKHNAQSIINNQSNIQTNKVNISKNKTQIQQVDNRHSAWNRAQDVDIKNNTSRINDLDNRLGELEDTQQIVGGEVRIHDSKKWQVNLFADYSVNRNKVDRTGIRFTYKFGESYEEKRINELERRLQQLESR